MEHFNAYKPTSRQTEIVYSEELNDRNDTNRISEITQA